MRKKDEKEMNQETSKSLADEQLEQVIGGNAKLGYEGKIAMYTSNRVMVNLVGQAVYRHDSKQHFFVTSISNNYDSGKEEVFSTTYLFQLVGGSTFFSFTATRTDNRPSATKSTIASIAAGT